MTFQKILFLLLCSIFSLQLFAGGIRGTIKDEKGQPLPFATIYIKSEGTGTTTNVEGNYSINLVPGTYECLFQYLGYQSLLKTVTVRASGYTETNVILKQEILDLKMIEVVAGEENPAYTIMRKTIAKSKYHLQQLDSYNATVYMKGTGRLVKAPFWIRRQLKKEGIDANRAFTSESVSEISYKRPNTYTEKVISVYSHGDDNSTDPNQYLNGSFYEPKLAGSVSPLSPKAFGYYRFALEGTFLDQGDLVYKIRVTPRSKGDKVFEGTLNIVDEEWSIHSLDLTTYQIGIAFNIKQIYEPIQNVAWQPVSHTFDITGKILGFRFEYKYLATVSNYEIELNPDLQVEMVVIDETIEKEKAAELKQASKERSKKQKKRDKEMSEIQEKMEEGKEISRKDLRKMMRNYEKQEQKEQEEPKVESNRTYTVDSLATKRDSAYWASVRSVPLTTLEIAGYAYQDSIVADKKAKKEAEEENPSGAKKKKKSRYMPWDILSESSHKLAKGTYLNLGSPMTNFNFNTVEGYRTDYDAHVSIKLKEKRRLRIGSKTAYSFARNRFMPTGYIKYDYGGKLQKGQLRIEGGRQTTQINEEQPIAPTVNTFMTLLFEDNYMKILEKDFLKIKNEKLIRPNLRLITSAEWAKRTHLENEDVQPWFKDRDYDYTSNSPVNLEIDTTFFETHKAFTIKLGVEYEPWQRYYVRNGKRQISERPTPIFSLNYNKGIPDLASSSTDFDQIEVGVKHKFEVGVRGTFGFNLKLGHFINDKNVQFPDFKHFKGNRTPFVTTDPVETFRILDYYDYSTDDTYFIGHAHYQFRKFLVTQILEARFMGIKENVFVNYLGTNESQHYTEVGYTIENIFRFFRLEFVSSFQDYKYENWGVRIGISSEFGGGIFSVE